MGDGSTADMLLHSSTSIVAGTIDSDIVDAAAASARGEARPSVVSIDFEVARSSGPLRLRRAHPSTRIARPCEGQHVRPTESGAFRGTHSRLPRTAHRRGLIEGIL